MGGRAAEQLVFGELSTGAADDIARATAIARDMVTRYGMDEGLGHVSYAEGPPRLLDVPGAPAWNGSTTSPDTAERIDAAVQRIVQAGFDLATSVLTANRAVLDRAAQALLAKETLDEAEIAELAAGLVRQLPVASDALAEAR
jgi:cell division protease FtsH